MRRFLADKSHLCCCFFFYSFYFDDLSQFIISLYVHEHEHVESIAGITYYLSLFAFILHSMCICIYKQTHQLLFDASVCVCIYTHTQHTFVFNCGLMQDKTFSNNVLHFLFFLFSLFTSSMCCHKKEKDKPPTSPTMHLTQGCLGLFLPLRSCFFFVFFQGRHLFYLFIFFVTWSQISSPLCRTCRTKKKKKERSQSPITRRRLLLYNLLCTRCNSCPLITSCKPCRFFSRRVFSPLLCFSLLVVYFLLF